MQTHLQLTGRMSEGSDTEVSGKLLKLKLFSFSPEFSFSCSPILFCHSSPFTAYLFISDFSLVAGLTYLDQILEII